LLKNVQLGLNNHIFYTAKLRPSSEIKRHNNTVN